MSIKSSEKVSGTEVDRVETRWYSKKVASGPATGETGTEFPDRVQR
jgi:hypothetical protein